jgi:hypothetical protein
MNTQQFTHAILACHNVHQAGKLMVTLGAYGSVSDAYYAKPTSTHVDCDGITVASTFEESVYLLAGLILTRLASSLPISMLAHRFTGLILTRLASSLPISRLAKLSSSVLMIHSQRLASSLLHSNDIDKAGKLIANICFLFTEATKSYTPSLMKPVAIHLLHALQTRSWKHAYMHIYIYIYIYVSQGQN